MLIYLKMSEARKTIISQIRQELKQQSDPQIQAAGKKFFKEEVKSYGIKTAKVSQIVKAYKKQVLALDKGEVFALCEELWQSGYLEEFFIACEFSYAMRHQFEPADFMILQKWVNSHVSNWASCDTLCNHTIGAFLEMYPSYLKNLKTWAKSANRWVKRASAVSLIVPARQGKFLETVFAIADILLEDEDDLVQKGYGWMLKVASQKQQKAVFDYVMKNKAKMPRTALRYAIEKMPKDLKVKVMER